MLSYQDKCPPSFQVLKQNASFPGLGWQRLVPLSLDWHLPVPRLQLQLQQGAAGGMASSSPKKQLPHELLAEAEVLCLLLNTKQLLTFRKSLFPPIPCFQFNAMCVFPPRYKKSRGGELQRKLWIRNGSMGPFQLKCTPLSLASPRAKPTEYGQDFYEHINSRYSAEQQLQIGHYVISAGKFFINTLRKSTLKSGEGWAPQLTLMFSSSHRQSYGKFINTIVKF